MTSSNLPEPSRRIAGEVEWSTIVLAILIYGGWLAVTYAATAMPIPVLFVIGGWFTAWHGSLQHELIHGHPTASRRFNHLLASAPLSLWLPFDLYRRSHLAHHRAEEITHPTKDPESWYLDIDQSDRVRRALSALQAPLIGRLVLGPPLEIGRSLVRDALAIARRDRRTATVWLKHLLLLAPVLAWLTLVCHLSLIRYALCFVYPGTALLLLRSFAEHRADSRPGRRVALVEQAPVLGLLFLNNNLHAAHHQWPNAPWRRLPRLYAEHRDRLLSESGGLVYAGYGDVARRFLFRAHDRLDHGEAIGLR